MSDAGYSKPNERVIRKGEKARRVDKRFAPKQIASEVPPGSFLPENNAWRTGPVRSRPLVEEMHTEVVDFKGTNFLMSNRDSYNHRTAYKESAYSGLYMKQVRENMIDTWYDAPLYGKINFEGIPVFPNEYYLRQFKTTPPRQTIFGLNFVVRAFEDMVEFVAKRKLEMSNNNWGLGPSDLDKLTPTCYKSWNSPRRAYEDHFARLYSLFYNTVLERSKKQIVTFEQFMEKFYEFVDIITPDIPVTFSGWYTSRYAGLDHTGLIVELYDMDYGRDPDKQKFFIDSQHFKLLSSAAENHGFMIDKNIPWRLVANLRSKRMKTYMQRSGIAITSGPKSGLFDNMYDKAYRYDIEFIRVSLAKMWENFIDAEPWVRLPYACGRVHEWSNVKVTKQKLIKRESIQPFNEKNFLSTRSNYFKNYNDLHWLRLYYYVRAKEKNKIITPPVLDRIIEGVYNEYKRKGIISAIRQVNEELT